jgi:hypothetical protein
LENWRPRLAGRVSVTPRPIANNWRWKKIQVRTLPPKWCPCCQPRKCAVKCGCSEPCIGKYVLLGNNLFSSQRIRVDGRRQRNDFRKRCFFFFIFFSTYSFNFLGSAYSDRISVDSWRRNLICCDSVSHDLITIHRCMLLRKYLEKPNTSPRRGSCCDGRRLSRMVWRYLSVHFGRLYSNRLEFSIIPSIFNPKEFL